LTLSLLKKLLERKEADLKLEAVHTLAEHPDATRFAILADVASDRALADAIRAQALLGLSPKSQEMAKDLVDLALGENETLAAEALRALVGVSLSAEQRRFLEAIARGKSRSALVARVLGKPAAKDRPPPADLAAWLKLLEGPADIDSGRRVFFHPKLAGCYRCHRVEGRGKDVGPDLSAIGQTERRAILESILQPSNLVAPHYQAWHIETHDGKVRTGMLVHTHLDDYTYLDEKGNLFKLTTRDIAETRPSPTSIMPSGLVDMLTDQEMRDLLAYLVSRK
jgi:putative heme-binding domain-containing protein